MSEQDEPGHTAEGLRLAEEIRLLVELVVERAAPWLEGLVAAGHGRDETPEVPEPGAAAGDAGGSGCGWCPLCAIVAVVRGERPEFAARLLEQAAQLVALLRAVLADRWEPDEGVHMPGFRPAPRAQDAGAFTTAAPNTTASADDPGAAATRVQHIAVRKREDWRPEQEN
ncbi:hypothetical protein VSH64_01380 [Amycolatopsis rhabdoformis]|uniref:DUF2267 domain-containing protein n=1 Tax=Amycolatopsis rhabdoformis TaxID=1448059 RepID=A0ABZ1I8N2_9PSEU|nr:hypothetical protein [Amycolatopsis rhabdoformis]WSE30794.1 hypothetical protein VSH64_01380 [Amycolatopsis rhabdoformis]